MKCSCGGIVTKQTNLVARKYAITDNNFCLFCLSKQLNVPYNTLLDKYRGLDECRECTKNKRLEERKLLLGLR